MDNLVFVYKTQKLNKKKGQENENSKKLFAQNEDTIAYIKPSYRFLPRSYIGVCRGIGQ